jgi:protein-disulfide isomerase
VIVVEYGDYECPHCRAAHGVVQRVIPHFGDRMAFVFRHFPLTEIHPNAEPAAEASEYAGAGGKFWEMHDAIYLNQDALGPPLLFELTTALGLSQQGLRDALERETYAGKIRADFMAGVRSGVNGTPTFFINGRRHEGSYDFDSLVTAIDEAMPIRR